MRLAALVCAALLAYIPLVENSRADTPYSTLWTSLGDSPRVRFTSDVTPIKTESGKMGFVYKYTCTNNSEKSVMVRWEVLNWVMTKTDLDAEHFIILEPKESRLVILSTSHLPVQVTGKVTLYTPWVPDQNTDKDKPWVSLSASANPLFAQGMSSSTVTYFPLNYVNKK